jgi:hypothetical protein
MFKLTFHAIQQILSRKVVDEAAVLDAVNKNGAKIERLGKSHNEVRVIVKTLKGRVVCPDGSNGNLVVACIDPKTQNVKTVMLTNSYQVNEKIHEVPYIK